MVKDKFLDNNYQLCLEIEKFRMYYK